MDRKNVSEPLEKKAAMKDDKVRTEMFVSIISTVKIFMNMSVIEGV